MEVAQITMDPEAAKASLEKYRARLRRGADEEYSAAAVALEHLAAGQPLLDIGQVFLNVDLDEKGRPLLAIARADRTQVYFSRDGRDAGVFHAGERWAARGGPTLRPRFALPALPEGIETWNGDGWSLVPMIPPDCHPGKSKLRHRFVLWEVEGWADKPIEAEPDRDPFLLEHVHGDLYAIEAAWDLTDLERAIMAGRREP